MEQLMNLAVRLRLTREKAGLSRLDLAYKTGLHPNSIGHFELGKSTPNVRTLVAIARACKVSISDLLPDGVDLGPPPKPRKSQRRRGRRPAGSRSR